MADLHQNFSDWVQARESLQQGPLAQALTVGADTIPSEILWNNAFASIPVNPYAAVDNPTDTFPQTDGITNDLIALKNTIAPTESPRERFMPWLRQYNLLEAAKRYQEAKKQRRLQRLQHTQFDEGQLVARDQQMTKLALLETLGQGT